jgi:hypothetical protein
MPYRLAVLAVALVLAGTGLWLAALHASSYVRVMDFSNEPAGANRIIRLNENGIPEMYLCNNLMCKSYSQIRQEHMNDFAIDAAFFAASMGLVGILYAWRRRTKAQSIV